MSSINVHSEHLDDITIGTLRANLNASQTRVLRYYIDFRHNILNLHKELSAPELDILQGKVDVLMSDWDERMRRYKVSQDREAGKSIAEDATLEAEIARQQLHNLLAKTLKVNDAVDWNSLKRSGAFPEKPFVEQNYPVEKPRKPQPERQPDAPKIGLLDKLFLQENKKKLAHEEQSKRLLELDKIKEREYSEKLAHWATAKTAWDEDQKQKLAEHVAAQRLAREEFEQAQLAHNARVDDLNQRWRAGDPDAIIEHVSMVLEASKYPGIIPKQFEIDFDTSRGILLVDYEMPSPDKLPSAKTVRFNATTGELAETKIAATELKALYDSVCYQLCLRTIHEIFEADTPAHIKAVAFNGIVHSINAATGHEMSSVLLSVLTDRAQFLEINLAQVDPKACFKSLKGVAASSLYGMAPITPVIALNKVDKRFIEGRSIEIDNANAVNLAAMHWDDFEHLIRELFEKEFAARGGEVRVTQASSDGGVDAVAFDPDPISGGKIVIQAKRYTRTVGVAAVRDLYGTTQSEGANKGILVTTADYGPDAYQFAQGKPITLMNGSNLLFLLQKHGMQAKINLAEARKELGLTGKR